MQQNPNPRPSRREALAVGLGTLAAAAVPVMAGPTAEPRHAFDDDCPCPVCRAEDRRRGSDPLILNVLIAAAAAKAQLDRLIESHCRCWCDLCLDASGAGYAVEDVIRFLEGDVNSGNGFWARYERAAVPNTKLPAHPAAIVSLFDLLDALLELTAWHCDAWTCSTCSDCDKIVYHVGVGLDMLSGRQVGDLKAYLAVEERQLLSARRKVARERRRQAEGAAFLPHSEYAHLGADDSVKMIQDGIRAISKGLAKRQ